MKKIYIYFLTCASARTIVQLIIIISLAFNEVEIVLQAMLQQCKLFNNISQPLFQNSPVRYFSALLKQQEKYTYLSVDDNKLQSSFEDGRCHEFASRVSKLDPECYNNYRMILDLNGNNSMANSLSDEYAHYYRVFKRYKLQENYFVAFNFASKFELANVNQYYLNQISKLDSFCDYIFNNFVSFASTNYLRLSEFPSETLPNNSLYKPLSTPEIKSSFSRKELKANFISPILYKLTYKERIVIEYTAMGLTSKEISEKMFLSRRTIENHLYNIKKKLGINIKKEDLIFHLTGKIKKYVDAF